MTHQKDGNVLEQVAQLLNDQNEENDGFRRVLRLILNETMCIERSHALGARHYERSEERTGYANGYKPKTLHTRMGALQVRVPQVRGDISFYPSALEKGVRSERALKLAIAEMYVQGVSTRKVTQIVEQLCGLEVSSSQVSRCSALLDAELELWRNRSLSAKRMEFLMLDARYEKVRYDGVVRDCAVLSAIGIDDEGRRSVLGVSVALSEAEVHWREFLASLQERGLHGVKMVVSDSHAGLKAALTARLPSVPWQRCQFHLQQNAGHHVPRQSLKGEVAQGLRAVFQAPNRAEAERLLKAMVTLYEKRLPDLANWLEKNVPQGLTVFALPECQRRHLRTTNPLERLHREIKRRTRVAGLFPNTNSVLRMVTSILMETSEDWECGKVYLPRKKDDHQND